MNATDHLAPAARPPSIGAQSWWTSAFRLLGQTARRIWRAYWRRRARRIIALLRLSMPHLELPIANLAAKVEPSATPRSAGGIGHLNAAEARRFAETWLPAWTSSNAELLASFYAEDTFYLDPGIPAGVKGKQSLLAYFKKLLAYNPDWVWSQIEGIPLENGFLNKWRARIPIGSTTLEIVGACFVQLDNAGKIRRNEVYFDRSQLLAEIAKAKQRPKP